MTKVSNSLPEDVIIPKLNEAESVLFAISINLFLKSLILELDESTSSFNSVKLLPKSSTTSFFGAAEVSVVEAFVILSLSFFNPFSSESTTLLILALIALSSTSFERFSTESFKTLNSCSNFFVFSFNPLKFSVAGVIPLVNLSNSSFTEFNPAVNCCVALLKLSKLGLDSTGLTDSVAVADEVASDFNLAKTFCNSLPNSSN